VVSIYTSGFNVKQLRILPSLLTPWSRDLPEKLTGFQLVKKFSAFYGSTLSRYYPVQSGVPQGSVLGPLLYLIFTADIPTSADTLLATFADDTAIMSSDSCPDRASEKFQQHLNALQTWLDQWKVKRSTILSPLKSPLPPHTSIVRKPQSTIRQYQ
jgi:hypothetical protein